MQEVEIRVFMYELVAQSWAMHHSATQLYEAQSAPVIDRDDLMFLAAQSMLTTGALISKILVPSQGIRRPDGCRCPVNAEEQEQHERMVKRCKELRKALGYGKGGIPAILQQRKVRNGFEHFDARLDDFFASSNLLIVDRYVGPVDRLIERDGKTIAVAMRRLDPDARTANVLDDSISLEELSDAVIDVGKRAQQWLDGRAKPLTDLPAE
ncbi:MULTISPECIES: hypothetical protein [unclassified Mycobacterium]|uniref:hypothetical protein n=1 Tax=unclassified Mycobacterium TaxID=2642494 RepID=UPI0012E33E4F|nr:MULTISPECIES: hypothetical protein [unclassified Mycobacterium]